MFFPENQDKQKTEKFGKLFAQKLRIPTLLCSGLNVPLSPEKVKDSAGKFWIIGLFYLVVSFCVIFSLKLNTWSDILLLNKNKYYTLKILIFLNSWLYFTHTIKFWLPIKNKTPSYSQSINQPDIDVSVGLLSLVNFPNLRRNLVCMGLAWFRYIVFSLVLPVLALMDPLMWNRILIIFASNDLDPGSKISAKIMWNLL